MRQFGDVVAGASLSELTPARVLDQSRVAAPDPRVRDRTRRRSRRCRVSSIARPRAWPQATRRANDAAPHPLRCLTNAQKAGCWGGLPRWRTGAVPRTPCDSFIYSSGRARCSVQVARGLAVHPELPGQSRDLHTQLGRGPLAVVACSNRWISARRVLIRVCASPLTSAPTCAFMPKRHATSVLHWRAD
jgi:hypothetical protein